MKALLDRIEEKNIVHILQQMIRIRTIQPDGHEKDMVKYLCSLFSQEEIEKKIIDHGRNRASLILTLPGVDRSRSIAVTGHIDTIGASNFEEWEYPPFAADHVDGKVYGRGAADMKGGLASMVAAALVFVECGEKPPLDVHFCFTADEEVSGIGANAIVGTGFLQDIEEMVVIKPTDEKIGLAEKGAIWLDVEIKGRNFHAAMPERGISAISSFVEFTDRINSILKKGREHEFLGRSSCVITSLKGGEHSNIVPDKASGKMDIRTLPSVDHDKFLSSIHYVAEEMEQCREGLEISINVTNNRPPVGMSKRSPFIKHFQKIYEELGLSAEFTHIPYFTDASIYIPNLGVPFIFLGPGDSLFYHQNDEFVSVQSVINVAKILVRYISGR